MLLYNVLLLLKRFIFYLFKILSDKDEVDLI